MKDIQQRHIVTTADGSHSIFVPQLNEHYHSTHGSLAEAMHIYVRSGLELLSAQKQIRVFEMGLGTGLNALCAYIFHLENKCQVDYVAVEKYPLDFEEVKSLNYLKVLQREELSDVFAAIHQGEWSEQLALSKGFSLRKIHSDVANVELDELFDMVFYDAFAPEVQADLWSTEVLGKMHALLKKGGLFLTYCVKGEVRRKLLDIGFSVEKLKGPEAGKREILRAVKI